MTGAWISEIFLSLQGEGPLAGVPFLFVRFCGCNLNCSYCDTRWSGKITGHYAVHGKNKRVFPNPVGSDAFKKTITPFDFRYITFTGGEPLLQAGFIESVLPSLKSKIILMETNGTLPGAVSEKLLKRTDYWSVDIKLPSASGENTFALHRAFANKMKKAKNTVFKTVFSPSTPPSELKTAHAIAMGTYRSNPDTQLVYQPVYGKGSPLEWKNYKLILEIMKKSPMETRLLPQLHKVLKWK